VRFLCATPREDREATAFLNADGMLAIIALNRSDQLRKFSLSLADDVAIAAALPRSISSYVIPRLNGQRVADRIAVEKLPRQKTEYAKHFP
jgi:membrane protein DedA with SNARE-associated domain